MGGSSWNDSFYHDRAASRAKSGASAFAYDHAVATGKAAKKVHEKLDPKGVTRESRDSAAHPNSNPVIVLLDQTGSMRDVISDIHGNLPTLMGLLTRKNYLVDPQVLFGAIGDASNLEAAPLQIGQFESGIEMEDDLSRIYIEGNGGGQRHESYQLGAYFALEHTVTDAWEKRKKKGYFFIIGDEMNYVKVRRDEVENLIGDKLEADLSTADAYRRLQEKWICFFVLPKGASYGGDREIISHWQKLIGDEHVIELADPKGAAAAIAAQIGLCEDAVDLPTVEQHLRDEGVSTALVRSVASSVRAPAGGAALARVESGALAPSGAGSSVKRL